MDSLKKSASAALCARRVPPNMARRHRANRSPGVRRNKLAGTEMERKIAEATNNKPWGASSTMLQEIAQGTFD